MNILYYLDWFPRLSQSFVLNEIYHLKQRGHEVAVFALNPPESNVQHDELEELDLDIKYADQPTPETVPRHLLSTSITMSWVRTSMTLQKPRQMAGTPYLAKQCLEFVHRLDYDIDAVHSHFLTWNKLAAALVADRLDVQSSIMTHAYDLYEFPNGQTLRTVASHFDSVVTISEYNRSYLKHELELEGDISIVRMGVRPEKFSPSATTQSGRIFTVARFVEKKGLVYGMKAVASVIDEHPEITYHIVGSGPKRDALRRAADRFGIADRVTFLGSVSDDRLITELDDAELFLLPCVVSKSGDRDGIPVVLMEAMAMKTPVVTTRVSGIPELVSDGENGFLAHPRRPDELATKISQIRRDEGTARIEDLCRRARSTVEETYNADRTVDSLEAVLRGDSP